MDSVPANRNHCQEDTHIRNQTQMLSSQSTLKIKESGAHLGKAATVDECKYSRCAPSSCLLGQKRNLSIPSSLSLSDHIHET